MQSRPNLLNTVTHPYKMENNKTDARKRKGLKITKWTKGTKPEGVMAAEKYIVRVIGNPMKLYFNYYNLITFFWIDQFQFGLYYDFD